LIDREVTDWDVRLGLQKKRGLEATLNENYGIDLINQPIISQAESR